MNIDRLFRGLDTFDVEESTLLRERKRMAHLNSFPLWSHTAKSFPYQLGGMTGLLSFLCFQKQDVSEDIQLWIMAKATEGASRIGLAYGFHPQRESYVSLTEAFITKALIQKRALSSVSQLVPTLFSLASQAQCFSSIWCSQILSTVDVVLEGGTSCEDMPDSSLSIEPLYHQERLLSETMVLGMHPLPLVQHTAIEALEEILLRHIRAANKRLRYDQLDHVDVFVPYHADDNLLRERMGALLLFYPEPIPSLKDMSALQHQQMQDIMRKIRFFHHKDSWKEHWNLAYKTLGGLYSTATSRERGCWLNQNMGIRRWEHFWLERVLSRDVCIDQYAFCFPVYIELYTTRGGCWKEKRQTPNGVLQ